MPIKIKNLVWNSDNDSSSLLNDIFKLYLCCLEKVFDTSTNGKKFISDIIEENSDSKYNYFWNWFNNKGNQKLEKIISTEFPVNEEVIDFLEFRHFVLLSDYESNINESILYSLADTIDEIYDFIKKNEKIWGVKYSIPEVILGNNTKNNENWKINQKPAEYQQVFCYY